MNILIDTGPIVALLDGKDAHHPFVDGKMRELKSPFYTCEAVITESFFLLQRIALGTERLIELLETDKIRISFAYKNNKKSIHQLMERYTNIPMSFADACLVQMYETTRNACVFTLDTDFAIYRTSKSKAISVISPDS